MNLLNEGNLEQELSEVDVDTIDEDIDDLLETLVITKNSIKHFKKNKKNEKEKIKMEQALFLNESVILSEKAKFSLMPKFKMFCDKYPEMRQHAKLISEVESLLIESGKGTGGGKAIAMKIARCILRVYGMLQSINSVILLPMCIFILPIVSLLGSRMFKFLAEAGEFKLAEAQSNLMIKELTKLKNETKDASVKKKCDAQIEALKANKKKLVESVEVEFDFQNLEEAYNEILFGECTVELFDM